MLFPPAMRDQDPQPSQPFGARKPRPEELEAQKRAAQNKAPAVGKSTNLPTPAPQHINDHEMIRKDLGSLADGHGRVDIECSPKVVTNLDVDISAIAATTSNLTDLAVLAWWEPYIVTDCLRLHGGRADGGRLLPSRGWVAVPTVVPTLISMTIIEERGDAIVKFSTETVPAEDGLGPL